MVDGTILFAVGGVESFTVCHLFPAGEVLYGARIAAVAVEDNVEQLSVFDLQRHEVVHVINGEPDVRPPRALVVLSDNANVGYLRFFLNRQQDIFLSLLQAKHGMVLTEHLHLCTGGDSHQSGDH